MTGPQGPKGQQDQNRELMTTGKSLLLALML